MNALTTAALIVPAALIVIMRRRKRSTLENFNFAEAKSKER
jgi:hypothetical protein